MATLSIETKKVRELEKILSAPNNGLILCHDGNGLKAITVENFQSNLKALIKENKTLLEKLSYNNAGAHNAIYRGKNLGSSVTSNQYSAISAGTFDDLYIGDYWVINNVNWRIAAFDYYLASGDTICNTHHVTIVPDTPLDSQKMNSSPTTQGGYTGSAMYTANLKGAKNKVISAFGASHILTRREYLVNAVMNGKPSGAVWFNCQIELMTEANVYGTHFLSPTSNGSTIPLVHCVDKSQFPLFAYNPSMISNQKVYWLRNVVTGSNFASVHQSGYAGSHDADYTLGVRPSFSIKS